MDMIADALLGAGALGAALYCYVLAARLKKFTALEGGMGSAIAVLSQQVDEMTKALEAARTAAGSSATRLEELTLRAEAAAQKLELTMAAMQDMPERGVRRRRRIREEEDA